MPIIPQSRPEQTDAIPLILPLLSPKAYTKLFQLPSLFDLHGTYGVDLNGISLPLAVIEEEARVRPSQHPNHASSAATWGSSIAYALGTMGSYLSIPGLTSTKSITTSDGPARGYWDRSIEDLVDDSGGKIPPIFDELREVIISQCVTTEGIFRLTPNVSAQITHQPSDDQCAVTPSLGGSGHPELADTVTTHHPLDSHRQHRSTFTTKNHISIVVQGIHSPDPSRPISPSQTV
jgi:hypothetical protein